MIITTNFLVFLQIFLFLIVFVAYICGDDSDYTGSGGNCRESERMALLQLKAELIDDYSRLSSWESITNCCEWNGVVCDNRTDHVVALDLHGHMHVIEHDRFYQHPIFPMSLYPAAPLRGKISPSLLQLSHLQYLDLSFNDFNGTKIPSFIGSLTKLRHLNLSYSDFGGSIPHHIGNLSLLELLDLRWNFLTDTNLDWLSGSPSLQYLDLSRTNLEACSTWLQVMHKLTALKELHLSGCEFPTVAPISVPSINSSNSLLVLDLSFSVVTYATAILHSFLKMGCCFTYIDFSSTSLSGSIPDALWNLNSLSYLDLSHNSLLLEVFPRPSKNSSSLTYLDLSGNNLNGQVPRLLTWLQNSTWLEYLSLNQRPFFPGQSRFEWTASSFLNIDDIRLPNLEYLDLSMNNFTGRLPNLSSSQSLRVLDLFGNAFNGSLSESIEHLSKIESLHVGYNRFDGVFNLSNHPHLRELDLSFNLNITLTTTPSWIHPVQFQELDLADCKLGPYFPAWLQNQNQLRFLDISNSGIIDTIPSWFWGNIYECQDLNMSRNQIYGVLPDLSSKFNELVTIDLSSNEFNGSLPHLPHSPLASIIDLSRNRFSGTILSICNFNDMCTWVDLSNNQLSGEIPQGCFMKLLSLAYLNLANNNLSGEIPATNNLGCDVLTVHLRNNSFRGEIPRALMNCSKLRILDLGENEFSGNIPGWLGESIPDLGVLILKSNMLYGSLPPSICHLKSLQVLDISLNNITGPIPNCVNNFSVLSSEMHSDFYQLLLFPLPPPGSFPKIPYDSASVMWKGHEETYFKTLGLLKMIDLSSNELSGVIPHEITSLVGLFGLNLSRNNLVGLIPQDIDKMEVLNFLDLSRNNLSGSIPPSLSKMSHLGVLDLSFNNLSGRIPWDSHLQTFEASSFSGNPRLCGPPLLSRPCPEAERPSNGTKHSEDSEEEKFINTDFYISLLLGLVVAFWITFWSLFFNKWWNVWSMRICITVADWLYVKVLVNKRRLLRYFNNAS